MSSSPDEELIDCARWLADALNIGRKTPFVPDMEFAQLLMYNSLDASRFLTVLADGRILRQLLQRLRGAPARPDADLAAIELKGEPAVSDFLEVCKSEFNIPDSSRFQPQELQQPQQPGNLKSVLRCLRAVSRCDAAAVAGLRPMKFPATEAIITGLEEETEDEIYIDMETEKQPTEALDDYLRWMPQVLGALDQQVVGFFWLCRMLEVELRDSPLSLWSPEAVQTVFNPYSRLLKLFVKLRTAVRSGQQPLDVALGEQKAQLVLLYAQHRRHLHLTAEPMLKELQYRDEKVLAQVAQALTKLTRSIDNCAAKSVQDLMLLPMRHLKRLSESIERSLAVERIHSGEKGADVARKSLQDSLSILRSAEKQVNDYSESLAKELLQSHTELCKLKWPAERPALESFGRHRRSGWMQLQPLDGKNSKRIWAILWDRRLVFASGVNSEVTESLEITHDLSVDAVKEKIASGLGKRYVLRLCYLESSQRMRSLICDSKQESQAWQNAFNEAKDYSFPPGFKHHEHDFQLTAVMPEHLEEGGVLSECQVCSMQFGCWAYRCAKCNRRLHRECVFKNSMSATFLGCLPKVKKRNLRFQSTSSTQQAEPQMQQQKLDAPPLPPRVSQWIEPEVLDPEEISVRLRELKRGRRKRNFLVSPASEPVGHRVGSGYQLHVLSGDNSIITYVVEKTTDSAYRIEGAEVAFRHLSELVQHYAVNPLPPSGSVDDPSVYEVVSELLVLDSGLGDCE